MERFSFLHSSCISNRRCNSEIPFLDFLFGHSLPRIYVDKMLEVVCPTWRNPRVLRRTQAEELKTTLSLRLLRHHLHRQAPNGQDSTHWGH